MDKPSRPEVQSNLAPQASAGSDKAKGRTQAERIYEKFGGVVKLHAALKAVDRSRALSNIYRWNQSKAQGGTDGLVPSSAWRDVLEAARHEGIVITGDDFLPGSST